MLNEDIDEYRQRRDLLLDQITESTKLQKNFVHLLCEDLFLRYYLLYQEYIERMFIVYSLNFDKIASKTQKLKLDTYIMPTNEEHAKELMGGIKDSGATIRIDWSNCDNVLKRAHLYFGEDSPFRIIISSQKQSLQEACYIRNYIAHRSPESYHRFKKNVVDTVIKNEDREWRDPGELLAYVPARGPSKNKRVINYYISMIDEIFNKIYDI